ncbi:hypothetical protein K438DRAFT_1957317 [Mycena galopus ATCC 62051]|nr:hypothetical protein K438DRAFT_1957317 [Mycena galopus ATCC 62051]
MSTQRPSQKRLKKPPACDSCKARRVLCHPQPNGQPCPRCAEKNNTCTTTPVVRRRARARAEPAPSPSSVVSPRETSLSVALMSQESPPGGDASTDCPPLNPEFVAHCFECFEFIGQVSHPLIRRTRIKDAVAAASFELHLLAPQCRVLALCIIAVASLASFHESVLGPGPRPNSLADRDFFSSTPNPRECGVRRATAYHAFRAKAAKSAWEIGVMLEPTEENAASCYLLDLLEQSDSSGASRPWAAAYISHIRALAPRWRAGRYTASDEGLWMGFLMTDALYSTVRRLPLLIMPHDQLMLSGPEPSSLESFLQSLESSKNSGPQVLWASWNPYGFHVISLARQLSLEINGGKLSISSLCTSVSLG